MRSAKAAAEKQEQSLRHSFLPTPTPQSRQGSTSPNFDETTQRRGRIKKGVPSPWVLEADKDDEEDAEVADKSQAG
jgi:hypothetical protein